MSQNREIVYINMDIYKYVKNILGIAQMLIPVEAFSRLILR